MNPSPIPLNDLKHLRASFDYASSTGKGNCIQRSAALALDLGGSEIVFATFRAASAADIAKDPRVSRTAFIHAWVEWRGWAYSPTTLERTNMLLVPWDREAYRTVNGARDVRVLPRDAFERIARRFRLSAAFRYGRARAGHGELADALLNAAGVRYRVGEGRAVLPVGDEP